MPAHRRTVRLAAALGSLSLLAVAGCGVESGRSSASADSKCPWKPDTSVKTEARIAYQNIPNGDIVVRDLGVLEACMPNAKVTWTKFASGGDVVQAYGADAAGVDLGLMGSSPATKALSAPLEIPLQVVWIHDVIGAAESLVARDGAADLAALKGKKVAVPFGSTAHYSLLQALTDAGIDSAKDVTLINLEPEKMVAAWQRGDIDAAWVWDPVLSELKKAQGTVVLTSEDTAKAGKPTYDLGTASAAFVEENPDFMTQWAKAQDYAVSLIADDPDKAAESVAATLGIEPDEAKAQFEGLTYLGAADQASSEWLDGKLGQDLFTTAGFLKGLGEIDQVGSESVYVDGVNPEPAGSAAQ